MFNLIGLAGRARSGKDTVAAYLLGQPAVCSYALADPVKMACQVLFGLTDIEAWSDTAKETPIALWQKSPRQLFQLVGTEWMRQQRADHWLKRAEQILLHPDTEPRLTQASLSQLAVEAVYGLYPEQSHSNFWGLSYTQASQMLSALCLQSFPQYLSQRAQRPLQPSSYTYPDARQASYVVIRDIRYENEADFIRRAGGQIWHIQRDQALAVNPHSSEDGIHRQEQDAYLDNNGSLEQLYAQAQQLWQDFQAQHPGAQPKQV